jgi:hypothetical protein
VARLRPAFWIEIRSTLVTPLAQIATVRTMALGHGMQHAQQTMRSIAPACPPEVGAITTLFVC